MPLLVSAGHDVAGMTRSPEKVDLLRSLGATPVLSDVYDPDALVEVVVAFAPDTIVNELTDLPDELAPSNDANKRMRREGTRNLLAAAEAAQVSRFVAQSVAWRLPGDAGEAVEELERTVLNAQGVVLRYGRFYGPGTYYPTGKPDPPRVQIDEAARRTVLALDAPSGVIEIVELAG